MECSYEQITEEEFTRIYQSSLVQKRLRRQIDELDLTRLFDPHGLFVNGELRLVIGEKVVTGSVRGHEQEFLIVGQAIVPPESRRQGAMRATVTEIVNSCSRREIPFALFRENTNGFYRQYGARPIVDKRTWECHPTELLSTVDAPAGRFRELQPEKWELLQSVYERYIDQFSISIDRTESHWQWVLSDNRREPYRVTVWEYDGEPRGYVVYDVDSDDRLVEVDLGYVDTEAQRHMLYYLGLHEPECNTVVFEGPDRGRMFDIVGQDTECTVSPEVCAASTDVAQALECISAQPSEPVCVCVSRQIDSIQDKLFEIDTDGCVERCSSGRKPDVSLDTGTLTQFVVGYRPPAELARVTDTQFHTPHGKRAFERAFPAQTQFIRDEF